MKPCIQPPKIESIPLWDISDAKGQTKMIYHSPFQIHGINIVNLSSPDSSLNTMNYLQTIVQYRCSVMVDISSYWNICGI